MSLNYADILSVQAHLDANPPRCCTSAEEWVGGDPEKAEQLRERLRAWHEKHGVPPHVCER